MGILGLSVEIGRHFYEERRKDKIINKMVDAVLTIIDNLGNSSNEINGIYQFNLFNTNSSRGSLKLSDSTLFSGGSSVYNECSFQIMEGKYKRASVKFSFSEKDDCYEYFELLKGTLIKRGYKYKNDSDHHATPLTREEYVTMLMLQGDNIRKSDDTDIYFEKEHIQMCLSLPECHSLPPLLERGLFEKFFLPKTIDLWKVSLSASEGSSEGLLIS